MEFNISSKSSNVLLLKHLKFIKQHRYVLTKNLEYFEKSKLRRHKKRRLGINTGRCYLHDQDGR
jgi:hypothetical protein